MAQRIWHFLKLMAVVLFSVPSISAASACEPKDQFWQGPNVFVETWTFTTSENCQILFNTGGGPGSANFIDNIISQVQASPDLEFSFSEPKHHQYVIAMRPKTPGEHRLEFFATYTLYDRQTRSTWVQYRITAKEGVNPPANVSPKAQQSQPRNYGSLDARTVFSLCNIALNKQRDDFDANPDFKQFVDKARKNNITPEICREVLDIGPARASLAAPQLLTVPKPAKTAAKTNTPSKLVDGRIDGITVKTVCENALRGDRLAFDLDEKFSFYRIKAQGAGLTVTQCRRALGLSQ